MVVSSRKLVLQPSLFRGYVSFREGILSYITGLYNLRFSGIHSQGFWSLLTWEGSSFLDQLFKVGNHGKLGDIFFWRDALWTSIVCLGYTQLIDKSMIQSRIKHYRWYSTVWVKYKNSLSELRPFLESVSLAFTTSNTFYGNDALVPAKHRLPQKSIWAKFTVQFKNAQPFFCMRISEGFPTNTSRPPYQHHNNKNRWMNSHQQLQVMVKPYSWEDQTFFGNKFFVKRPPEKNQEKKTGFR